jgi:hypothetical protein
MKTFGKHRYPGRLFVVEGIDGSGTSTQLALLQKWLESEGYGMDLHLGEDIFDCFVQYQQRLLTVFDVMAGEYGFHVFKTARPIQTVSEELTRLVEPLLVEA